MRFQCFNLRMLLFYFLLSLVHISQCHVNLEELRNAVIKEDISNECAEQILNLDRMTLTQMIDSSAKSIPGGILKLNLYDLGYYDECLAIEDDNKKIYGKYCLVSIKEPKTSTSSLHLKNQTEILFQQAKESFKSKLSGMEIEVILDRIIQMRKFAICIPDKCTADLVQKYLPISMNDSECYTKFTNSKMETSAVIALVFFLIIALLAVVSTVYELTTHYNNLEPKHSLLVAFSFVRNGKKIFSYSKSPDQLSCLNGLKSLNMLWVVLGHSYFNMALSAPVDNLSDIYDWMTEIQNMFVISAPLSVDTFFTIGGLLTVYVFIRSPPKQLTESFLQIPLLYVHRYIRLTPALGAIILFYGSGLVSYIGDGPRWNKWETTINNCAQGFLETLFYFQNYKGFNGLCVVQSWYLSVDFQLFIFSPFLLIPLKKWPKYTIPSMCFLAVIGMIIPFLLGYDHKTSGVGLGSATSTFMNDYYLLTYTRFSPYVIGMLVGYLLHKLKTRQRPFILPKLMVLFLWALTILGHLACIFDGHFLVKNTGSAWSDGIYMGFNKSVWSLSVCLLIILCCTGYGGPVNQFLSLPFFHLVAKLSYSMYLTHYAVLLTYYLSTRTPFHIDNYVIYNQFFSHTVITLVISLIFALLFEYPMMTIEKFIFGNKLKKKQTNK